MAKALVGGVLSPRELAYLDLIHKYKQSDSERKQAVEEVAPAAGSLAVTGAENSDSSTGESPGTTEQAALESTP
jgi:hypothetical protein